MARKRSDENIIGKRIYDVQGQLSKIEKQSEKGINSFIYIVDFLIRN
jgi:hypothetical protein